MRFKIFGRAESSFGRRLCADTADIIKNNIPAAEISFLMVDDSVIENEGIFYIPTVICNHNGAEIGYIENDGAVSGNTFDIQKSDKWFKDIDLFSKNMFEKIKDK